VPVTVARIDFDNANTYTIAGPNPLTFDAVSGDTQINVTAGSHTIAAPVTLADNTLVTVTSAAGKLAITGPLSASGVTLTKSGAGTLTLNNLHAAGLSINAGTVTMAPHAALAEPSTSVLGTLSIAGDTAPAAKLDLTNNAAIIDYAGLSPASTVRQQIVAGRGGPGLGKTWNGKGITSSAAATANAVDSESRSIGYAENSQLPLGPYTSFRGQPVDGTSLLIAYTRTGDANLDGVVNDDDVTIIGANYEPGVAKAAWALGDFDYNGFVDDDDVTLLGAFYNPAATPVANPVAVPEPGTTVLAVIGAIAYGLVLKRRQRVPPPKNRNIDK
jgi:autotransporter-associated beta strand protein